MPVGITLGAVSLGGTIIDAVGRRRAGQAAARAATQEATALEQQGTASRAVAESQAGLADYNAAVADLQAQDAIERGAQDEGRFRSQVRGILGSQRAGTAAGNIDVGFGSAVDVQADAAYLGEIDALTVRTNALREAWGYQTEAADLRHRATIARQEGVSLERAGRTAAGAARASGQAASTAANVGLVGTLLGGGASLLQLKYGFDRTRTSPAPTGGVLRARQTTPLSGKY